MLKDSSIIDTHNIVLCLHHTSLHFHSPLQNKSLSTVLYLSFQNIYIYTHKHKYIHIHVHTHFNLLSQNHYIIILIKNFKGYMKRCVRYHYFKIPMSSHTWKLVCKISN